MPFFQWICNDFDHSHKKRKDSLEARAVLLILSLGLEISGVAVQRIHKNSKKLWLLRGIAQWNWLSGCFSHFPLLWLWCQRFWGSSEDCYGSKQLSQTLFLCFSWLSRQNISWNYNTNVLWFHEYINQKHWKKVGYLLTRTPPA